MFNLATDRLRLRQWRDEDLDAWAAMSRDPEVMACFPALLSREEADRAARRQIADIAARGYGFWAVERGGEFIGFCGIKEVWFDAPFTPAVEVGWRLARSHWGHGYATEAARAALTFGFEQLGLAEIVAFMLPANAASARVCERLGMTRDPSGDFDHPAFTDAARSVAGLPQRRHILFRGQP